MENIQKRLPLSPYFLASNTIAPSTNTMEIFANEEFGKVRVIKHNGEPWFVARDVAVALGYEDPSRAVQQHCKKSNKITQIGDSPVSVHTPPVNLLLIPESDVYRLVMRSNLPSAERFQDWVVEKVLPAIRRTGGYIHSHPSDTPESIMARAVLIAQDTIKRLQEKNTALEHQANVDRPKVVFAESIEVSKSTILVGELAKLIKQSTGYSIGQKRLFEWMRDNGFLHKSGSQRNMPTQRSIDRELFVIKEGCVIGNDGESHITKTSKVTGKGQLYFMNRFKEIMEQAVT